MAATAATSATSGLTSRALLDPKAAASRGPHSVRLPAPPQTMPRKTAPFSRMVSRSVIAMATGETPAEASTELPEIFTTVKEVWDKLDDKYAVATLAFAGIIALWSATGMILAIDRLPIIPGVLELVGIGYTGWFIYCNLVFKPDREALLEKVKSTYSSIIGSSS
ncbi:protein CURVATURE THYLAKOID 1B, chloroplastic [Canna indica]|uniref:Protein CURVATURE THYLAKOID 1B, chloroplastic n=1 Tax=Canna indica TaxID=4628 RepID=A0AAQ3KGU0_9LILI|nr:protein CURVATURE THYLAKOID 1B, chloroplastic [Canna indica]